MNRTPSLIRLALVAIVALAAAGSASAQTTMDVSYQWTAPTTGAAVDHYVVEHSVDGGAWTALGTVTANQYTLAAEVGVSHRIRVAGVDALGRQGVYSDASDPYTPDPGSPGQPGKPIIF
jgi:hypothetical protein